jgi:hypothetical protein
MSTPLPGSTKTRTVNGIKIGLLPEGWGFSVLVYDGSEHWNTRFFVANCCTFHPDNNALVLSNLDENEVIHGVALIPVDWYGPAVAEQNPNAIASVEEPEWTNHLAPPSYRDLVVAEKEANTAAAPVGDPDTDVGVQLFPDAVEEKRVMEPLSEVWGHGKHEDPPQDFEEVEQAYWEGLLSEDPEGYIAAVEASEEQKAQRLREESDAVLEPGRSLPEHLAPPVSNDRAEYPEAHTDVNPPGSWHPDGRFVTKSGVIVEPWVGTEGTSPHHVSAIDRISE